MSPPRSAAALLVLLAGASAARCTATQDAPALDAAAAGRFARLALACVHQEYPNKIAHVLTSDADVAPPRELTPAFYGCYDWHSSVHGHWLLARLARTFPDAPFAADARAALAADLTPEKIAGEVAYLAGPGRVSFERPYGLAWLLQLAAELREWNDPDARRWSAALAPLERAAADRLREWLPKLAHPIRIGEHDQTAFAFGLVLDWARTAGDEAMRDLLVARIRELYLGDRGCPIAYEPSGQDFLSPCLAEADLVRRVLPGADYAAWLGAFLPGIPLAGSAAWLEPAVVADPSDPKLAHLDGLNLSPRLDARGDRLRPAHRRPAHRRARGRRRRAPPRRPGRGHRRALRRRPLAGQLRHLPGHPPRPRRAAGSPLRRVRAPRRPAPEPLRRELTEGPRAVCGGAGGRDLRPAFARVGEEG